MAERGGRGAGAARAPDVPRARVRRAGAGERGASINSVGSVPSGEAPAVEDPASGTLAGDRPLGVYVHFPFCSVRCPYCDFAVDTRSEIPHDRYADAVIAEVAARAPWFMPSRRTPELRSIYFGGGTPGLWRPEALGRVIHAVRTQLGAAGDSRLELEITVEANPGEVTAERLAGWRAAGVNRLSLGVQALDDRLLGPIGRNHDAAAGPASVQAARAAGFEDLSCDLMFGLPGQTLEDWRRAVDALIALGPTHVSTYALTIERGTRFGALDRAGRLARPDDEQAAAMYLAAHDALGAAGYEHYEVSSYARPGRRARHNSLYWTGGAYLGVGCSAASFRPLGDGTGWRFTNPRATDRYLAAVGRGQGSPAPALVERRSAGELENEAAWLGLRLVDGLDRAAHAERFGADPLASPARAAAAARLEVAGWLAVTPGRVHLTRDGWLFADEVAERMWV
jgi:oxygen-independent coproporphyrinogen-3 oxidase